MDNVGVHHAEPCKRHAAHFGSGLWPAPAPTRYDAACVPSRGDPLRSPGRGWEANFDHPYLDACGAPCKRLLSHQSSTVTLSGTTTTIGSATGSHCCPSAWVMAHCSLADSWGGGRDIPLACQPSIMLVPKHLVRLTSTIHFYNIHLCNTYFHFFCTLTLFLVHNSGATLHYLDHRPGGSSRGTYAGL